MKNTGATELIAEAGLRMGWVGNRERPRIAEDGGGFLKAHAVLGEFGMRFALVPTKNSGAWLQAALTLRRVAGGR